ncbi:MAG TPA: UDP-N-acetylmuramate dehydrogenase [Nitrospirae bacterium]|nr:UDP-N-acetylmuramate dehydrogenase [Nitrospirota bacterium]
MKDLNSNICEAIQGEIRFDEPMSAHTSLKIGGPVDILVFPEDPVSLKNTLVAAEKENIPLFVFGAGTNLLASDSRIEGIAVSLKAFRSIEYTKETDEEKVVLCVGAGTPLVTLINFACEGGYSGIEGLVGIPGYVGGAVFMNAGSFATEIKDVITSIAVMNAQGEIFVLGRDELNFSYRNLELPEGMLILSANIVLKKDVPSDVSARTREFMNIKKATQPLGVHSAGCVFKNPEADAAGKLIDAAGCKGMRVGGIEVSQMHANYFINKNGGTCAEFLQLMEIVKKKIMQRSGIELETEIKIIGSAN